ncbi:hypothetical protein TELCIR_02260 [Teladorsagia circumcincta]|uniref:Amine oxidase domain-containing protein n=1 Tax=Teladorsagia circumcincta TaxID=45464 RepID=A0A2G9UZL3_TELCI|nr:hypothetical protein TELCIR_02260 [Teladorsagia circumcincta]
MGGGVDYVNASSSGRTPRQLLDLSCHEINNEDQIREEWTNLSRTADRLQAESKKKESNKAEPSIAIVGAGMSGLSAARRLIETGRTDIDIYEGMDRIGGRIHPVPYRMSLWALRYSCNTGILS